MENVRPGGRDIDDDFVDVGRVNGCVERHALEEIGDLLGGESRGEARRRVDVGRAGARPAGGNVRSDARGAIGEDDVHRFDAVDEGGKQRDNDAMSRDKERT